MDIRAGDILQLKKPHPCGERRFRVLRTGMDLRLQCLRCGHSLLMPRLKAEKSIQAILREEEPPCL